MYFALNGSLCLHITYILPMYCINYYLLAFFYKCKYNVNRILTQLHINNFDGNPNGRWSITVDKGSDSMLIISNFLFRYNDFYTVKAIKSIDI